MAPDVTSATSPGRRSTLQIDEQVVRLLRERLPQVAAQTVAAVIAEVPGYTGALSGAMGENIEAAVQMALGGFLKLAAGSRDADPSTPLGPTLEGAYALGRGEARSGRSMDALLAAYRVGARVAWRELAGRPPQAGVEAGHDGAVRRAGVRLHRRALRRQRRRPHRRAVDAAAGSGSATASGWASTCSPAPATDVLDAAAERAELDAADDADRGAAARGAGPRRARVARRRTPSSSARTCRAPRSTAPTQPLSLLLVPDADGAGRRHLIRVLAGRHGRGRSAPAVDAGPLVVRPRCCAPRPARRRPGPRRPGRQRGPPRRAGRQRRPRGARRPAGPGARAAGRPAARHRASGSRRRCGPGCCTRAAATPSPPSCTCTRRRCATGWVSCASCTATGSTTRRRCSTYCSRSAAAHRGITERADEEASSRSPGRRHCR